MTKSEAMRITRQQSTLMQLGFTMHEADSLRRISMTLRRWHEKECGIDGGCIERDDNGRAMWRNSYTGKAYPVRDMETGAKRRLALIVDQCNKARRTHMTGDKMTPQEGLGYYVQTDPRGAALYIIRPGDIPAGQPVDSCYSRGICVY